ncbi:hypothetical protein N197_06080 [Helicobacter pylori UM023]|uniref:type IV secretion system apparatus protein CagX n=1 Tax=Helicobacter pylori TaxID=210 RepID=UPI000386E8D2|nr:type IV secretion system apparatus protein CagX [Helicobacter pylori]EPZ68607.1 hypothetical protein N197_06080 [Helicobacter pylori UM023]
MEQAFFKKIVGCFCLGYLFLSGVIEAAAPDIKNFNRGRVKVVNKKIAYLGDEKPITIWTSLDNVTVIQLEKDETISYITTGFNKGWSIVPNSNHIFIQPKSVKSNLMFEKEAVNFALMTRDYQEFLKTKKLIVDAPDPKELEEQKKALEKEKEAKEQAQKAQKDKREKRKEERAKNRANLENLTNAMSNPQNLSNNKNLSEFIKQQRENELDQMERLEDMQEQAQANALKQIEELNKKQAEEAVKQRAKDKINIKTDKSQKSPEDNSIELSPSDSAWRTNLVVRTNKALYQFILRIAQKDNFASAYLTVKLEYPQRHEVSSVIEEELKKREEAKRQRELIKQENLNTTAYINRVMMASNEQIINKEKIREEKQKIILDQAKALETQYVHNALKRNPVPRNYNYYLAPEKRSKHIMPSEIFDDGTFTYFGFKNITLQPAIFVVQPDGKLSMTDAAIDPNMTNSGLRWYRVNEIAEKFKLIKDKALVTVINKGYGKNPLTKNYNIKNYGELERVIKKLPLVRDK